MSQQLIASVWERFPEKGTRLVVMLAIAGRANEAGSCAVSMNQLAWSGRLSRVHVCLAVGWLRKERWIFTEHEPGQGRTLVYQINVNKLNEAKRIEDDERDAEVAKAIRRAERNRKRRAEAAALRRLRAKQDHDQPECLSGSRCE